MLSELFYPYLLGGAEKRYWEVAKRLARKHKVTVYALKLRDQYDYQVRENVEIIRLGLKHPMNKRELLPLLSYHPFLKSLKSEYDIIDANQGIASFIGLYKKLRLVERPIVATFHDIYWNNWNRYFKFPLSCLGKTMEMLFSKMRYSKIIANSPKTREKLERLGLKNIEVIPSGIDLELIKGVRAKRDFNSVVYVGRLVKYKNVDLLIKAVAKIKKERIKLKVVGSGPEENKLRMLAKKLHVDVEFYGFASEVEKIKIIKSSSILVNPSDVEGLGLVLLESMACKTPVIAKNLDCYFFCNKENSILIDSKDFVDTLSLKIYELLKNEELKSSIVKNGYETAKKFTWDKTANRIEKLYLSLLKI